MRFQWWSRQDYFRIDKNLLFSVVLEPEYTGFDCRPLLCERMDGVHTSSLIKMIGSQFHFQWSSQQDSIRHWQDSFCLANATHSNSRSTTSINRASITTGVQVQSIISRIPLRLEWSSWRPIHLTIHGQFDGQGASQSTEKDNRRENKLFTPFQLEWSSHRCVFLWSGVGYEPNPAIPDPAGNWV